MAVDAELPIESLGKLLDAVRERGVDESAVLETTGIEQAGVGRVTFRQLAAAYEAAARLTGDPDLGLHVGEGTTARMYGLIGHVLANAETLRDALAAMVEFQRVWSDAAGFRIAQRRSNVHLRYWQRDTLDPEHRRQESEQMLAAMVGVLREALDEPFRPLEVRFEHRAPTSVSEHRRVFGCRVRFGMPATEVILANALLDRFLPKADPTIARLVRREAEAELLLGPPAEGHAGRVRDLVREALAGSGDTSLRALAAGMRLTPRTLQRRLRQQGLTHRQLVEGERIALAKRLLETSALSLGEIAFRLGYSQPSAFHRAFRRHIGLTPMAYRVESLGGPRND